MASKNSNSNNDIKITWELDVEQTIRQSIQQRAEQNVDDSNNQNDRPYMVAIVGIPGSGKTTGSQILADRILDIGGFYMSFDGYHIPLKGLNNDADLIYRRGAPDTFDVQLLQSDLRKIRYSTDPIVSLPTFDHAKGDPELDAIQFIRSQHKVVICEGLYLLHTDDAITTWDTIKSYFDYCIYIDANIDLCMDRLKIRNQQIPGYTPEEINIRVDIVDRTNALFVAKSKSRADLIVKSVVSE